MAGKITRTIVSTIFLVGILVMTLRVQNVQANGTIYIRTDGSIDPPATPLLSVDNATYTFVDNVYGSIKVERNNITIDGAGHTLQGSGGNTGVSLSERDNVTIKNMEIKDFDKGVYLYGSLGITISRCRIRNNAYGIHFSGSSSSSIYGSNITANSKYGVLINLLSTNNLASGNNVADNGYGFLLDYVSELNSIFLNNVVNNQVGIAASLSSSNQIFHNNFVNNTAQALVTSSALNTWDNGYPSGGNYWSDYNDTDVFSGPFQNETGSDGILDHPYVIEAPDQDNYPLATPLPPQDTTPPMVLIVSPENSTYGQNVPLVFTVNEATSWMGYSLDNEPNVAVTGNTTLSPSEGSHSIVVYANDTVGNVGSSSRVYFTVDTTPPSITQVVQSPTKENVYPTDKVKVNVTVTDALAGVKQVILNYTTNNVTWFSIVMTNVEGSIFNATIPEFPADTSVNYLIRAEDNVGNVNMSGKMEYTCQYPVIAEFASVIGLFLFMAVTLLVVVIYRRKYSR